MITRTTEFPRMIEVTLSASETTETLLNQIILEAFANRKSVFKKSCKFYSETEQIISLIWEKFPNSIISENYQTLIYNQANEFIISFYKNCGNGSDFTRVEIYGGKEKVNEVRSILLENFIEITTTIEWVYNQRGCTLSLPVTGENYPLTEFYPFINTETIEDYYDQYVNSSSSILILIGPPGTGKTSFVRGFLHHSKKSATLSYDARVLENDDFFADFIRNGNRQVLILEDADSLLAPRKDGNNLMMKFLNIGEGLVSARGKKIIFTTNLPNTTHIDQALVRPGRCFDILHFDKLTPEQAKTIAVKMNLETTEFSESLTLAEVFNPKNFSNTQKKIGFYSK